MPKYKVINPNSNELLYEYDYTNKDEAYSALELLSEKGRLEQKQLSPFDRFTILLKLRDLISRDGEKLAKQIHLETGKKLNEAKGEVQRGLVTLQVAAEEAKRITSVATPVFQHVQRADHQYSYTQRCPLGVIFCITPFNFPLNLALHKIAPAFASGNTILFKPHEHNYEFAKMLMDLCYEAGISKNIIQMVMPEIDTLNSVVQSEQIACISFTGGTSTANKIAKLAGRKKLLLELGGNGALVGFEDSDIEKLSQGIINGRLGVAGQTCTSSKRIFLHENIYSQVKENLLSMIKEIESSPLINETSAIKVESLVQSAIDEGAKLLFGHKRENCFYTPTLLEDIPKNHEIIIEETFGPIICLIPFKDENELVYEINNQPYGLQAGVFTQDIERMKRLFEAIEVGSIGMNMPPGFRQEQLPFGGVKASGIGREGISFAIEEMTYIKQLIF